MVQRATTETQDRAIKSLAGLLPHVDPAILPDVIACLGESGSQARAALPVLEKLLDAPEPGTRASAALAMLAIDEKPTPRILAALLDMVASKDLPQDWRMDALGRIRGGKAESARPGHSGLDPPARRPEPRHPPRCRRPLLRHHRGHAGRDAGDASGQLSASASAHRSQS